MNKRSKYTQIHTHTIIIKTITIIIIIINNTKKTIKNKTEAVLSERIGVDGIDC